MKKSILLLTLFTFFSCNDFLQKDPLVGVVEENFYNTEEDAIAAVNAAYAALQFEMTPGGHFHWFWGDVMSDDSDKGGSGPNDTPELGQLESFQGHFKEHFIEYFKKRLKKHLKKHLEEFFAKFLK